MTVGELKVDIWADRWPSVRLDMIKGLTRMTVDTLDLLEEMCHAAEFVRSWRHKINSAYRAKDKRQHGQGRAVDIVFYIDTPGDIPVDEQFRFAQGFPWGGIGVYPEWNTPGLHVDTRQGWDHIAYWWRDAAQKDHGLAEYAEVYGVNIA